MVFKNLCVLVLWMKVASILEGLKGWHFLTVSILSIFGCIFYTVLDTYMQCIVAGPFPVLACHRSTRSTTSIIATLEDGRLESLAQQFT